MCVLHSHTQDYTLHTYVHIHHEIIMVIIKDKRASIRDALCQEYISIYVWSPLIPGSMEGTPQTQSFMKQAFQDRRL